MSEKLPIIDIIACAQNAEDVILYRAFKNSSHGTYVDLGAGHPLFGSVTKHLADRLGWKGVEVEANKELCEILNEQRPKSLVFNVAVSDNNGNESFTFSRNWAMSGLTENVDVTTASSDNEVREVKTLTLEEILKLSKINVGFEVLKVDIEGAETKVFKNFNLNYWKPKVIVTEVVTPYKFKRISDLEKVIEDAGYIHCLFDGINSFFARKDETHLINLLSVPANVQDKYIPLVWWQLLPQAIRLQYPHIIKDLEQYKL
jgi:FkbM family methyltransferase